MQRLYDIGFRKVGRWILQAEDLVLQLDDMLEQQNVLYAFVSGDTVKYVGKTTQTLQRRMFGYQKPNVDQRTNWRNRLAIVNLLKRGQAVEILSLADSGLLRYGSFHLNLAAGLEDSIIQTLKPAWNGGRTSTVIETAAEANPPDTSIAAQLEEKVKDAIQHFHHPEQAATIPQGVIGTRTAISLSEPTPRTEPRVHRLTPVKETSPQSASHHQHTKLLAAAPHFRLTLQETYYRTGFFNVPVNCEKYFGGDMENITIYCGSEQLLVTGKINRTANNNGTPRIMGQVPLRAWFQKRKPMSHLKVAILGPRTIHINDA